MMHRLRLLAILLVGMLVLAMVVFARMGNAQAASPTASLNNCGHWTVNTSPNPGTNNVLDGVAAVTKNDTWAVGYTDNQTLTEHWNGNSWSVVPSANESAQDQLVAVTAISKSNVWAVGSNGDPLSTSQPMAEHWNGSAWSLTIVPAVGGSSQFASVARIPGSSNVWAVGHSTDINNVDHTLIEFWNGTTWSIVPSPDGSANGSDLLGVTATSANSAWAVGTFQDNAGNFESLIEHWNGHVWKVVASPNVQGNGVLWSVAQIGSTGNVWAAGTYFNAHSGLNQTLIAYWNGESWKMVPSPNVANTNNIFFGVSSFNSSSAWAVGLTFNNNSSINHALTVFWNGTSWKIVSNPDPQGNSELNAITHVPEGNFYFSVGNSGNNGSYSTVAEQNC